MSKNKANTRQKPVKTPATKRKSSGLNDARETRKFFMILGVCTLVLVFFLYLIFMRTSN
jgi:hypothetical protein